MNVNYQHFSEVTLRRRLGDVISPIMIVQIYLEESPALIQELIRARNDSTDIKPLSACAHKLKGSLSMLSATKAAEIAEQLGKACRRNDMTTAHAICDQFINHLQALTQELNCYLLRNSRA